MINQIPYQEFITRIWYWKYLGIFYWVSISYLVYILYAEFLFDYFGQKHTNYLFLYPIIFLTASAPLYFYSLSLTIVPIRKNVLSLVEFIPIFLFYLTYFIWILLHLYMYISDFHLNIILAGLIILSLFLHLDYTIIPVNFISDTNDKPFTNRFSAFKEHCLYNVPFFPIFISFFYFYITDNLYVGLIYTSTMYISYLFPSICSLISGEKVSFAGVDDGSRLISGLSHSKSKVVQYWAYNDFLGIANDYDPSRREFIFSSTNNIGSIIVEITKMLNDMAEKHNSINYEVTKAKSSLSKPRTFKEKIKYPYTVTKNFFTARHSRTLNMKTERNAACNSIIAIMGIQSLVRMILLAEKEDEKGEIQQHAETILNSIINLYRSCMRTQVLTWKTPPFGKHWILDDYQKLTVEVLKVSNKAIVNLIVRLGYRFDMTNIEKDNKECVDSFMKNGSDLPSED